MSPVTNYRLTSTAPSGDSTVTEHTPYELANVVPRVWGALEGHEALTIKTRNGWTLHYEEIR